MDYSRVTPRARAGTTGLQVDMDVEAGSGVWISPPDRVAAVTVAVHIPATATASYTVEVCCNSPATIGENGAGGYWDNIYGDGVTKTESAVTMLANAVTGIRVRCIEATAPINVCFVG